MYDTPQRVIPSSVQEMILTDLEFNRGSVWLSLLGRITMSELLDPVNQNFLMRFWDLVQRTRSDEEILLIGTWIDDYWKDGVDLLLPASPQWSGMVLGDRLAAARRNYQDTSVVEAPENR